MDEHILKFDYSLLGDQSYIIEDTKFLQRYMGYFSDFLEDLIPYKNKANSIKNFVTEKTDVFNQTQYDNYFKQFDKPIYKMENAKEKVNEIINVANRISELIDEIIFINTPDLNEIMEIREKKMNELRQIKNTVSSGGKKKRKTKSRKTRKIMLNK